MDLASFLKSRGTVIKMAYKMALTVSGSRQNYCLYGLIFKFFRKILVVTLI